ncbi:MAG: hypothetical protein NUW06_01195 [Candidatus Acetothermia bacterium]|jgi:hypothetical protein|nr:hypothetical protein [Candidatus Acetothermia bacterium]MDH7505394.1 hypothetical protein [Candidatus Acetothermia bacterium]
MERLRQARAGVDLRLLAGMIIFGSLWGALEATLGAALIALHIPRFGAIMANFGFLLMAAGVAIYKRPELPLGMGIIAASFKLIDATALGVSPLAQMILNPMIAIVMEALGFTLAVALLWRWFPRRLAAQAGAGALGMALYYIGVSAIYLYILRRGRRELLEEGFLRYILAHGGPAAAIALFFSPLGYRLGRLITRGLERLAARPGLLYAGAVGLVLLCWAAIAWRFF